MDTASLKRYAPEARRSFLDAVRAQAARYGITAKGVEPVTVQGDVLLVGGQAYPKTVAEPRRRLVERIEQRGFEATMEAVAYTWFNRLAAIRYMELHGYLEHGYRVLSHPEGQSRPEILEHATDVHLPGLDRERVVELKLDGTRDEELYRRLLKAQCNSLHQAMPFLFEKIGDETELLLPANLLHTDSLVRQLVEGIEEDAWQDIEIIGWLYQFYISDKKDQVIGKVVKSEDIPAATQLFTPNWIVKYMVQNSLGAQWLASYPQSPLKGQMEYYVEPAEQTDEVKAQLVAITPDSLDPEALTLIDPACGSGHILVEAYDLLKAIYLERGYRQRDVARLILEKNLFGLDIDPRAAQLAGFALMMKGRADDLQLFERGVELNVLALEDSHGLDVQSLEAGARLADYSLEVADFEQLKETFYDATTFGSLIRIPEKLTKKIPAMKRLSGTASSDIFFAEALERLGSLVRQAEILLAGYDAVVANPPYMGSRGMNAHLKKFVKGQYPDAKSDLFACFIERGFAFAKASGDNAMVTMQSWMFLSSFQDMRERLLRDKTIKTLAHFGSRAFGSVSGEVVQTAAFVVSKNPPHAFRPVFFQLLEGGESEKSALLSAGKMRFDATVQDDFRKIPRSPVAYWISQPVIETFRFSKLRARTEGAGKNVTSDNARFVRLTWEVSQNQLGKGKKWLPYAKGGTFRKWYGNIEHAVDWSSGAREYYQSYAVARIIPTELWYRQGITWTDVTSGGTGFRYLPPDTTFDATGLSIFLRNDKDILPLLGLLNTPYARLVLEVLNPTLHAQLIDVKAIPVADRFPPVNALVERALHLAEIDWNSFERSWNFQFLPLLSASSDSKPTLQLSYAAWVTQNRDTIAEMKRLEEENNRLFIDAYGLADELTPDVPIEQITLTVNPAYRYGGKLTEEEQWTRFSEDTMQELVSYAVGCMMGRYSLDEPGLIYAQGGDEGFEPSRYSVFPADADGIVPLTDAEWFADDATNRVVEFISVAWDSSHLEENLTFLASNLSPRKGESSRDTIRRYLCDSFFKDHLKTYKKRPIYWLFSSGKQKSFQCLVYLHRYNEGTLARMRSEYVIPLEGKIAARIEQLSADIQAATSSAHRKRLEKEQDKLQKQQVELLAFDEKLRHYADRRIGLDLDDGVKVNYGKFGDLLAKVKAIHGKKAEEA